MPPIQEDIKKLEKKDWQLWTLTISILLIFCVFILLTFFYSDLQGLYKEEISQFNYNLLFLGFTALSLLVVAYVLLKERSIKTLRRDLINQKILTYDLENHFQELKALFEVSTMVNSQTDLPIILDTISKTAISSLGADRCSVMLLDKSKNRLITTVANGLESQKLKGVELGLDESVAGWVMINKKPLLLGEDLKDYDFKNFVKKDKKIVSGLCVPLKIKNKVKGVLNVSIVEGGKRFTLTDLQLFSFFADSAAIAIEKAQLHQELKSQTKTLERTIEDLNTTQNQLVQSEKLRALGDIASGVAHDFNNILAVILGRTELLLKEVRKEEPKKWLRVIEQVANDGAHIIRRLQEFTKTGEEKALMEINVNRIIRQVVDITRHRWKNEAETKGIKIEILTEFEDLPPLEFDPSELSEVLMNIVINAIDALPHGGKIILRSWKKDNSIYISVEDSGSGIGDEDKRRIFDPFFTTKGVKGVGLGLSVAYGIITRYGGEISVKSELNKGSTFVIKLPIKKKQTPDHQLEKSLIKVDKPESLSSVEKQQKKVPSEKSHISTSS
jgi:signal transduction histidine kinase